MAFRKSTLLGFFLVAIVALISSAECNPNLAPILNECGAKYGVDPKDVVAARSTGKLNCIDSCFFSCFMKKTGFMDDKGFFVPEKARETTKQYLPSDADLGRLEHALETCEALNYRAVNDGKLGCERAKMLATCILENKGFDALP